MPEACSRQGCLNQYFSLLPPIESFCLGNGLDLCCELIYKAPLLLPPPPSPFSLIPDVLAYLPDPYASVLCPLHGAGLSPIMLCSPVFVLISLDLWGGHLNSHLAPSLRRRRAWRWTVFWDVGVGLTWRTLQLVPARHVPSGLHVSTVWSNNSLYWLY